MGMDARFLTSAGWALTGIALIGTAHAAGSSGIDPYSAPAPAASPAVPQYRRVVPTRPSTQTTQAAPRATTQTYQQAAPRAYQKAPATTATTSPAPYAPLAPATPTTQPYRRVAQPKAASSASGEQSVDLSKLTGTSVGSDRSPTTRGATLNTGQYEIPRQTGLLPNFKFYFDFWLINQPNVMDLTSKRSQLHFYRPSAGQQTDFLVQLQSGRSNQLL